MVSWLFVWGNGGGKHDLSPRPHCDVTTELRWGCSGNHRETTSFRLTIATSPCTLKHTALWQARLIALATLSMTWWKRVANDHLHGMFHIIAKSLLRRNCTTPWRQVRLHPPIVTRRRAYSIGGWTGVWSSQQVMVYSWPVHVPDVNCGIIQWQLFQLSDWW